MELEVVSKISFNKDKARKVGEFWYDDETDALYHESPWWFPVQLMVYDNLTKCQVTPMFKVLPFILKGWINLDILLRQIELLKLVEDEIILMHGSCVDNDLIVGFPNSGKTYETYQKVFYGGRLTSEEYTKLNGIWASPYKKVMRTCFSARTLIDCGIGITFKEKLWLFFATIRAKLFPFMYEAVIWKEIPASGNNSIIKRIYYGSSGKEVTNWKDFAILCENEFPFMSSEFLQAYAFASGYDILGAQQKQRDLIKEFVNAVYSRKDEGK